MSRRTRVLVTGGAGYVGSHICKTLNDRGFEPVILDNLSTGHKWAARWGEFVEGDIRDEATVTEVLVRFDIQAVVHCAAVTSVGESIVSPGKYFDNNVRGSMVLLESMRRAGITKIVFSSSAAVYGIPREIPIKEASREEPISPYGESKLHVERMLWWYEVSHGFRYVSFRYFNAAGADPAADIGECHDPETHLIPLAIEAARGNGQVLHVYGSDYGTPDGTAIRDFVHVIDLARAHASAVSYLLEGGPSVICNLGSGCGWSVLEVIQTIEKVTGHPVPYRLANRRRGDPPVLVAAIDRARKVFGWCPQHDLVDIIRSAWVWHCNRAGA